VLFTLYLKNVLYEDITIVTYSKVIQKFCKNEHINHIDFEKIRPTITTFYKIFTLKKTLDDLIKKINAKTDDKVFITSNAKAYDSFYLAKELSKKGVKMYYKNTDLEDRKLKKFKNPWYKPIFIRGGFIRILLKIFLDLDLMYYDTHNVPCFGVDDKFFKKNNIKEYEPDKSVEELISLALKKSKTSFENHDNLIIGQGPLVNIVEFDSIIKLYEKIFELPIDFVFKKKPESDKANNPDYIAYYNLFKNCKEAPDYYPVELFINNIKNNIIAISSTALITASKHPHLKAISLLDLVEWCDNSYKQEWKENLIKASKNKILFPSSFEELKKILLQK